jgi:hypothetical protein
VIGPVIRALPIALAALAAAPAAAQDQGPSVAVALDPEGEITVGTNLDVRITVLVPTYMPEPPVWPDLQLADAITRLPDRATQPVTRRVGSASWSGLTRTYEITPQRAADFDLSGTSVSVTYADPDDNAPLQATVAVSDIAFAATVPQGAEALDPFIAAEALTLEASVDGLPETPAPGDALTLTVTAAATGTPSMLLPPLAEALPVPQGLRAYPRQPVLADTPGERGAPDTGTRTEQVTYVIEAPGSYALSGLELQWWNTAAAAVQTARTDSVAFDVPVPEGWADDPEAAPRPGRVLVLALLAAAALAAAGAVALRRHVQAPRPPSERRLYAAARQAARAAPPGAVRPAVAAWADAVSPGGEGRLDPALDQRLLALERTTYGPAGAARAEPAGLRAALLAALAHSRSAARGSRRKPRPSALPQLNPAR